MIPKTIHYCWFGGGEKPPKVKKCIDSWHRFCPDYEIVEWNEENFDVGQNGYTRMCLSEKKYAFLSDYARLAILEAQGGIYLDTDVEIVRKLDDLLEMDAFYGFENDEYVNTGQGFGAAAHHGTVQKMLAEYDAYLDGMNGTMTCPQLNTRALVAAGLVRNGQRQVVEGAVIFPAEYFNPYNDATGRLQTTVNTYSIHWYSKSWLDKKTVVRSRLTRPFHRVFGEDCFRWLKKKDR